MRGNQFVVHCTTIKVCCFEIHGMYVGRSKAMIPVNSSVHLPWSAPAARIRIVKPDSPFDPQKKRQVPQSNCQYHSGRNPINLRKTRYCAVLTINAPAMKFRQTNTYAQARQLVRRREDGE